MASPPPLRRSARVKQQPQNSKAQSGNTDTKKKRRLSSPSTGGSSGELVSQAPRYLFSQLTHREVSNPNQDSEKLNSDSIPKQASASPEDNRRRQTRKSLQPESRSAQEPLKQKDMQNSTGAGTTPAESSVEQEQSERVADPSKTAHSDAQRSTPASGDIENGNKKNPIAHWASTGVWPKTSLNIAPPQHLVRKRKRSPSSTQKTQTGEAPKTDGIAFEKEIMKGIVMDEIKGDEFVSENSKRLYRDMLKARYEDPKHTKFPLSQFSSIWSRVRSYNKLRILRDITPLIVPSAELLYFNGHKNLEHTAEELSVDWTTSNPLGGPNPRPDIAVGIAESAFTREEITKLMTYSSRERPTLFTDNMYFPFLVCEVMGIEQSIARAHRQCARASSMAVDAIIQLCRVLGDDEALKLSGEILVFSVSHTYDTVKIYGHYAIIEGAKTTFYRCAIDGFAIGGGEMIGNRKKAYDFVRKVYDDFYPQHLKRIRDIVGQMDDPSETSFASAMSIDKSQPEESNIPTSSSVQTVTTSKKPGNPPSEGAGEEAELLQALLEKREQLHKENMENWEQQRKENMEKWEQQYKENMEKREKREQEQEQRYNRLLEILENQRKN